MGPMNRCASPFCPHPAVDEYHFYQYVLALDRTVEVVWPLCEDHCDFALDVVEYISNLDDEKERERWATEQT